MVDRGSRRLRALMKRLILVAVVVVILIAALTVGFYLREWIGPRAVGESAGSRLLKECESIIDAAGGPRVSQVQVAMVLEEKPEIAEELKKQGIPDWAYSKKAEFLLGHPAWNSGLKEALDRARGSMIRECVLRRGLGTH
jgi:hypothetical protein